MKQKFSDHSILKILSTLKHLESRYPARMLRMRRRTYLRQVEKVTVSSKAAVEQKRSSR